MIIMLILCLTESWLDSESIVVPCLRGPEFGVVDHPHPLALHDLVVNHGRILLFSSYWMSALPFYSPSSFEFLVVHVVFSHHPAAIVAVIYRPGSAPVQQRFFKDLTTVLERAATYAAPIYVVVNVNIELD